MFCANCGQEVEKHWKACPKCGAKIGGGMEENKESQESRESQGGTAGRVEERIPVNPVRRDPVRKRSFLKYAFLSILTCGIYGIYTMCQFTEDVNRLCEGDGKKSPHFIVVLLLSMCTCGIYFVYWMYRQAGRIKECAPRYGLSVKESGTTIICWQIFGIFLLGVGPLVAIYMMFDNVNRLALVYNGERSSEEVRAMGDGHPKLVRDMLIAAGAIVAIIFLLYSLFSTMLLGLFLGGLETQVEQSFEDVSDASDVSDNLEEVADDADETDTDVTEFVYNGMHVKYTGHEVTTGEWNDRVLIVYFEFTNNSDENAAFDWSYSLKAFQNGVKLDSTMVYENELCENAGTEIMPGTTLAVGSSFDLTDATNDVVLLQVEPLYAWEEEMLMEIPLALQ